MKKLISMLCMLAMLLAAFGMVAVGAQTPTVPADASKWDGTVPEANKDYVFEGKGTKDEPWLIKSAAELAQFAANVRLNDKDTAYGGKYFKLTVDINIDNKEWWAIGGCRIGSDGLSTRAEDDNRYSYFAGIFDGDNHKIYNFALANTTQVLNTETNQMETKVLHQQGLFGVIMGATIKNIGIESGNIVLENSNRSGALVGAGRCGFLIENCYNKANVTITTNFKAVYVGAFMGQAIDKWDNGNNTEQTTPNVYKQKTIKNCYNTGDLTVTLNQTDGANEFRIGSIVGQYVGGSPEFIGVYSVCNINITSNSVASSKTNHRIGGITGAHLDAAYMEKVYFKGDIIFTPTVVTDLSKYTLGILIGQASGSLVSEPDADGNYTVGYCVTSATKIDKAVGTHAEPANWYKAVNDVVIPLAENCDFIVDIHAEPEPPTPTDPGDDETNPPAPPTDEPSKDTEKPAGNETTSASTTTAPADDKKDGCASSMGLVTVLLITGIASGTAVCVSRRKKHEE